MPVFQISEPLKRQAQSQEGKDQNITFITDKGLVEGCGLGGY